jgi:hypothetical protein
VDPSVEFRLMELGQFREHFEALVEAVCDAAQYGPTPKLESAYAREQTWIGGKYPDIRLFLVAYLPTMGATWEDWNGRSPAEGRRTDDFEALFAARTVDELLRSDNGSMISRINRTREALAAYAEHLRLLAARTA